MFLTQCVIGQVVEAGELIGTIGETQIRAPLAGRLRGLCHTNATIDDGMKVVEIDPREDSEDWQGLGERPRRIAEGVLVAITEKFAS